MGIFKREKVYELVNLDKLSSMIEKYLKDEKWTVQVGKTEKERIIIQARKDGILREIFAADRAFTIVLSNTDKGTKVEMGVGKWIQNIAVTVVESVLLTSLFLVIDVPEMLWNAEIENKIQKKIDSFIIQLKDEKVEEKIEEGEKKVGEVEKVEEKIEEGEKKLEEKVEEQKLGEKVEEVEKKIE